MALEIWRLLAEQSNVKGQDAFAFIYQTGEGVAQDYVMAFVWHTIATENGSKSVRGFVGGVENTLDKIELEEALALTKSCLKNLKSCPK